MPNKVSSRIKPSGVWNADSHHHVHEHPVELYLLMLHVPLMWSDQVMGLVTSTVACSYEEVVQCEQYCYDYTMTGVAMAVSVMLTHLCY